MSGDTDESVTVSVLGELEATRGGRAVPLGGPQQRLVLSLLIASTPDPLTQDRLQDALWGDGPPPTAKRTVQVYISNLRKTLGAGCIRSGLGGYGLDPKRVAVDSSLAEAELADARGHLEVAPVEARKRAESAVGRWRGRAFEGFRDVADLMPAIRRLDELHFQAQEVWFAARFADGETGALLPDLQRFCTAHPLRESAQGLLMRVLHRCGRTSEALGVYRRVERRLSEELGIGPSTELTKIEEQVLTGVTAPASDTPGKRTVPRYLDDFVGREAELEQVQALLDEHRIITLLGPGGTGKTRLATEALSSVSDPVTFVRLEGLQADGDLVAHLVSSVGAEPMVGIPVEEAIAAALGNGSQLLVLDNCEHVVAKTAQAVASLVANTPDLTVLTTSRIALGLPREVVLAVPTLSMPDHEAPRHGDAVQLFLRRARTRNPRFEISDENEEAIADICLRLDGLPLALELAASRMDLLSPLQLRDRLGASMDLLADRRVDGRHQSMAPTLDWSLDLLADEEEVLLRRMSAFRGPFDLDAIEAVCAFGELDGLDVLEHVGSLADKSMLQVTSREDGRMGYRLLVPLRELLEARIGESEWTDVKLRHIAYVQSVIEDDDVPDWPLRISAIREDVTHALTSALELGNPSLGLDLTLGIRAWLWLAGHREFGLQWTEALIEHLDQLSAADRAMAIHLRATALYHSQRLAECLEWTNRLVSLRRELGDPAGLAAALNSRGILLHRLDRLEAAEANLAEAQAAATEAGEVLTGDKTSKLAELIVNNRARVIGNAGRTGEALDLLQPLVELSRTRGPSVDTALALYHQAELLRLHGDASAAVETAATVMAMSDQLDLPYQEWSARHYYVHALADLGENARAAAAAESFVTGAPAHGEISEALLAAGRVIPDDVLAVEVLGATRRAMDRSEVAERWARQTFAEAVDHRQGRLPADRFEAAYERGLATPGPAAIRLAADALHPPTD